MVTYAKSKRTEDTGRWFSKCMGSMQWMNRSIRHTLCRGIWIDLDFVNCHPVLLQQTCKKLKYVIVSIKRLDTITHISHSLTHISPNQDSL